MYHSFPHFYRLSPKNAPLAVIPPAAPKASEFSGIVGTAPVPVERKIASVLTMLLRQKSVRLRDIYRTASSRSELVALFLAVLELLNDRRAELPGDELTLKDPEPRKETPDGR